MCKESANNLVQNSENKTRFDDMKVKIWAEYEEYEKRRRKLVESTDYIKWLEDFTKRYPSFSDDTWLYKKDEISKEDYANVCKISTFFSAIDLYARINYISGIPCEWGEYYSIEYNGKIYEIGTIVGQGAVSFCNTEDVNEQTTVIKFEEITVPSEATQKRTLQIKKELDRIDELLNLLYTSSLNIPMNAIKVRVESVLQEIKNNK